MNVVELKPPPAPPPLDPSIAATLRLLADGVESGAVSAVLVAVIRDNGIEFVHGATPFNGLVLADLLHHRCLKKMDGA